MNLTLRTADKPHSCDQDDRYQALLNWLKTQLPTTHHVTPASSDASFRRYFRVHAAHDTATRYSYIVMDAPPDKEDCRPFITIARAFGQLGLNTPQVLEADLTQGFLLLTDLGNQPYLGALNETCADELYGDALQALLRLQLGGDPTRLTLPPYHAGLLHTEMELFRDWFLTRYLQITLNDSEQSIVTECFDQLCQAALAQPQVWVHRDYHSRNLMVTHPANPGVLDFQDAVIGPLTYDLVSLLRDCYITWPSTRVANWVSHYHAQLRAAGFHSLPTSEQFIKDFDWMGVQRHLKAIGIFARLHLRDGKSGYLKDIPRTLNYVLEVTARYAELRALHQWLVANDIPTKTVQRIATRAVSV